MDTVLYISFTILFSSFIIYGYSCLNERRSNINIEDILFIESILDN